MGQNDIGFSSRQYLSSSWSFEVSGVTLCLGAHVSLVLRLISPLSGPIAGYETEERISTSVFADTLVYYNVSYYLNICRLDRQLGRENI